MKLIKTGIPGFDEILGGGIPRNRTILIQGDAGTGKSTLSMQYLINGISMNDPGLYLSLDYHPKLLVEDMMGFNWDFKSLMDQQLLSIVSPLGFENTKDLSLDELINYIHEQTLKISAKRIVIDSISSLEIILGDKDLRREIVRFTNLLNELDCTIFMIAENTNQNLYSYLAHGVINLYYSKVGTSRIRSIEVTKMRGMNHSSFTHSMNIQQGIGIEVLTTEIDLSWDNKF